MSTDVLETPSPKGPFKWTKRKVLVLSLITFIFLMLAAAAQISYMVLKYDKIYKGIQVNHVDASGMTKAELKSLLEKELNQNAVEAVIELKSGTYSEKWNLSDLEVTYDIPKAIEKAYEIGHTGNIFERFYDIFKSRNRGFEVEIPFDYNRQKTQERVGDFYNKTLVPVKEADLTIHENQVVIRSGHHGEHIDKDKLLKDLETRFQLGSGGVMDIPLINTNPSEINIDDYLKQINQDVKDASVQIVNKQATYTKEVVGRNVDKALLSSILAELANTENTEKIIPVTFTKPKVTMENLSGQLFKDELYSFHTTFKTRTQNEKNRGTNIRLDVAKINGTILAPGEVFSYNATVGKKSPEAGYKEAFTYVAGKMVAGLGGGICQVSTTLYNTVLYSDLEVVERRNHQFVVTYVPYGTDATVYYDSTDFKFRNNTKWPIQIKGSVNDKNQVIFTIMGTRETPGKTIKILSKQIGAPIPFPIKYVDDPSLPAKKEVIEQAGHIGGVFETYKVTMIDGKTISTEKISTSRYKPFEQVVRRAPQPKPKTEPPAKPATPVPTDVTPPDNQDVIQ